MRIASQRKSVAPPVFAPRSPEMANILVIEENPTNMTLAVFLLQSVGHSVLSVP
jgi:hypothetical protein